MPYSSPTKTRWSSDSERRGPATRQPAAPAPLIELNDVSLRFVNYADKQYSLKRAALDLVLRRESAAPSSEFWALRDMTFQITRGDRVGIVGGNGAGKSTLLRLLAKIYPPTFGQVSIRGNVAPLIEMGAGFNPELSGLDNILFNGALLGFSRSQMLEQGRPDSRVHRPARVCRHAAQVLFQRHVHEAGLRHRHRGQSRHPAGRRVSREWETPPFKKKPRPAFGTCSTGRRRWSWSLTICRHCESCARAGSGFSRGGWWTTVPSIW